MRIATISLLLFLFVNICWSQQTAKQTYNSAIEEVKARNLHAAIDLFSKTMALEPNNDIPVYGRALAKMSLGDTEGAIYDFSLAIEINPYNYQSYHNIGVIEHKAGNIDMAVDYFKKSIKIDPTNVSAMVILAQIYYDSQEIDNAINYFDNALRINKPMRVLTQSQLFYCYTYRASSLSINKKYSQALSDISQALSINGDDSNANYIRGSIMYEMQNYPEAIKSLDKAITLNPELGYGYFVRGMAKRKSNDTMGAAIDFQIAKQFGFIPEQ